MGRHFFQTTIVCILYVCHRTSKVITGVGGDFKGSGKQKFYGILQRSVFQVRLVERSEGAAVAIGEGKSTS